ncbi:MAG: transcription-repair coupling factor [Bacteroidetes bacterium]|nr:transcription-repair coupling factor [Bacteroidota bacterium]
MSAPQHSVLLQLYRALPHIGQLAGKLALSRRAKLIGLHGSSSALYMAAIAELNGGQHLVVCADKESAAYFYNDLENLLGDRDKDYSRKLVLFYPTSYKRPYQPEKADNTYILSRAEVLGRTSNSSRKTLVVSYPEALAERVVTRKFLKTNTLSLKAGEKVSLDFVADVLSTYNFERVEFVVEPGQFTIRGGIVDVFSYANDLPYRIEFFGDEVESIRSFDPATQRSVQKLSQLNILPNVQDRSSQTERENFINYLPQGVVVWLHEADALHERITAEYERASEIFGRMDEQLDNQRPEMLFAGGAEILSALEKRQLVVFGKADSIDCSFEQSFGIAPQPSFNKNFELLIAHWRENQEKEYQNILCADQPKQLERIQTIIHDLQAGLPQTQRAGFTPISHSLHAGFTDHLARLSIFTDHQIFERYHKFQLREGYAAKESLTIKDLYALKPGDYVTHINHGIGRFDGLEIIDNNGRKQEAIRLIYKNDDILYVSIHSLHRIAKYSGRDGAQPELSKLGSNAWNKLKNKTKSKVKDIARDLIRLYAKRKASKGFAFMPDTYLQAELEASFIYEDTPDQLKATQDVKADMEQEMPMDRLICGDVGFGKTEVAIRAAFKAAADNKQTAVLVPTTILAMQHYKTFSNRLKDFPVKVEYINRFRSAADQKRILQEVKEGKVDILIGTHRIISKDVEFKDLGLIIVDEEQKFGVAAKERLKELKANVDTLTLTATPIPRTLQFSMMGARDLSIINTPPPNRYPVQTEIRPFSEEVIREAIKFEIARGGQVFFVHNRVQNILDVYEMLRRFVPGVRIGVGHGQMEGHKLEEVMLGFIEGEFDVLLSTTIIESGLDIPNANTIIINDAQNFGLSDLHQLRGRVGRSNKKAFCYLLTPPIATLTTEARKRLKALEEFSDLGSGFNIALRDLDIRGAGNLLGAEQSGFISDIGFEMFHKILDEAIEELKEEEFEDVFDKKEDDKPFVRECVIESDLELLIPPYYVDSSTERIALYNQLDHANTEAQLEAFTEQLIDRFGPIPPQTLELINTIRMRWLARSLGFEKLVLRNKTLIAHFVSNPESPFYQSDRFGKLIQYIQANPRKCRMKQTGDKLMLYISPVATVQQALEALREMEQ